MPEYNNSPKSLNIGYIGNFEPPFSTENDRAYALNLLGHKVFAFQENKTSPDTLIEYANKLDLLLYSHTHDPAYVIPDLVRVFSHYKERHIPTATVHLDLWSGLARSSDVGKEASWFTEYIFTPDPSLNKLFPNHYYLPPGIKDTSCYLAAPDYVNFHNHDVVFLGSRGYHPEHPFRAKLLNYLDSIPNFHQYGPGGIRTIRGHELNTLIASSKIIIGDVCLSGKIPYYWSDRVPEVTGRGGFMLHPFVEGLNNPGVVYFEPENLAYLDELIKYYLARPYLAEEYSRIALEYTKSQFTYSKIMEQMLCLIFEK
jgi:Glycosyl transferases group 1